MEFKFEQTNKYSRLRNELISWGFDGIQTTGTIRGFYAGKEFFSVGRYLFVKFDFCEKIEDRYQYCGDIDDYIVLHKNY